MRFRDDIILAETDTQIAPTDKAFTVEQTNYCGVRVTALAIRLCSTLFILSCMACSAASSTADVPSAQQVAAAEAAAAVPGFRPLRLGGGGFVVDLDFSPDGRTRIVRTDVHGAYIWDDPSKEWKQLVNATSMPAGDLLCRQGQQHQRLCHPRRSGRPVSALHGGPGPPRHPVYMSIAATIVVRDGSERTSRRSK